MSDAEKVKRLLAEFPDLSAEELLMDDLPFIRIATINVCANWYNLGIYLHLPVDSLDQMRSRYRHNSDRCLTAVLGEWLRNPIKETPSWRAVVGAVAARVGGDNPAEARKIARGYTDFGRTTSFKNLEEVDNRVLSSPDMSSVKEALMEGVADKWMAIGLLLGISYSKLATFEDEGTLSDRVSATVSAWLGKKYNTNKFGMPSWRRLVEVVASRAGGAHNALAKQLAKSHPVQATQSQEETLYPSSSVTTPSPHPDKPADALSESDLGSLMRLLRPVVAKWELLMVQLGLSPGDLQIIKANPSNYATAPMSFLQGSLYLWLQQKPPNKNWPTVRDLCDAVSNDVIGEDFELAENIRTELLCQRERR